MGMSNLHEPCDRYLVEEEEEPEELPREPEPEPELDPREPEPPWEDEPPGMMNDFWYIEQVLKVENRQLLS